MAERISLSNLTELWLQESLGVFGTNTLEHYRALVENHATSFFGNRVDISREEVLDFIRAKKAEGLSDTTVYTVLRVLTRILEYGAGHGLCPAPSWGIEFSSPEKKRGIVILTPEEEARLSSYLSHDVRPMHLCIFLILTTGMTVGEVMKVRWEDVSIKNNHIRVFVSKGPLTARQNKSRKVRIGERQRIYLRKLQGEPESYICSGSGKPRNKEALESRWRKIVVELLLPGLTLTDLRHTYAVRCIEAGMDYETLASNLGVDNSSTFRQMYRELVPEEQRSRLEQERFDARKVRVAPEHRSAGPKDPEATPYRLKLDKRRAELQQELEALEGDLAIIKSLRYSDCVQGATRQGLYSFIEKVLGEDKDGQYLVEYLRCNMRVAEMPLLKVTTPQAIRRRVTHGFEKLNARLSEIYAVEGYDMLGMFQELCSRIIEAAPEAPVSRGPKPQPTVGNQYKAALAAIERIKINKE